MEIFVTFFGIAFEFCKTLIDFILHVDVHLDQLISTWGVWVYGILFVIVFCETGLVVTPFLPGDSLIFATGALIARDGSPLNLGLMAVVLISAAIIGDAANYSIGKEFGSRLLSWKLTSRLLNRKHLDYAQAFYAQHGGKTIIIARFVPIVRTFAPFVAGIGKMNYGKFAVYNVAGALGWVIGFLLIGNFFGNLPVVKQNFTLVIFVIIGLSVLPGVIEFLRVRAARDQCPNNSRS